MPDLSTLLLFVGTSLALLAIPGPAVIYVVTRSVDQGRRAGVVSVLGVETATFAYALAAAAGLTGLIAASELGFTIQTVYTAQKPTSAAPWHEPGGTWTFFYAKTTGYSDHEPIRLPHYRPRLGEQPEGAAGLTERSSSTWSTRG